MPKYTTQTTIVVQNLNENASYFAIRLSEETNRIAAQFGDQLFSPPVVLMTSASDGRQTANIQFFLSIPDKDEPLFPPSLIVAALENYDENENSEVIKFANWLMAQKKADYFIPDLKIKYT